MSIHCNFCDTLIDKTEETDGFGAMSIIKKEFIYTKEKLSGKKLTKKDFDICAECCGKILKFTKTIEKTE